MTYDELHDAINPKLREALRERFPVGGEREPVYAFLRQHGYVMDGANDKRWHHYRGRTLHLYGAGSMARITDNDTETVIVDAALDVAVTVAEGI